MWTISYAPLANYYRIGYHICSGGLQAVDPASNYVPFYGEEY
jgi:hypothetical protein